MTYKEFIHEQCKRYALRFPEARFIGYNVATGSQMYGTVNGIPTQQLVETPVAENLMMGLAMGMALEGYRPVVCFERHDFLLLALDGLVNHADKLPQISGHQFRWPIIVRAIVGSSSPLDPGPQHTQDYGIELSCMLPNSLVIDWHTFINDIKKVSAVFEGRLHSSSGVIVVLEYRDQYEKDTAQEMSDK